MREIECVKCCDTVVVAERGESITEGETPIEHMERTGHAHVREPVPTGCSDCGNIWMYGGNADRATCPNCRSKAQPGVVPDLD
jgi:ribosomal protein S27E